MRARIFWVGEELPSDSPCYIERDADRDALLALQMMAYISIPAPRQQGTTSLIKHLSRHPLLTSFVFVHLDTAKLDWTSEKQWYWSIYSSLSNKIPDLIMQNWVRCPLNLSGCHTFLSAIATRAASDDRNVVIALDKLGVVWKEWGASFLSVLRSLYTSRSIKTELNHLTFVLGGPFIPDKLVKQIEVSPFNVAETIQLTDFSEDQVRLLVSHLGYWDERIALLAKRIWFWTRGQPYLTQLICQKLSEIEHTPVAEDVDRIVPSLHREDQIHIGPLLDRWMTNSRLVAYTQRILDGEQIRFLPFENHRQGTLALLGILKVGIDGYCAIRNPIYERALREATGEASKVSSTTSLAARLMKERRRLISLSPASQSSMGGNDMDYIRGLTQLEKCLKHWAPSNLPALHTLAERFKKNQRDERILGSSENIRNERSQIIYALNELALEHCGISFNDLCQGKQPPTETQPTPATNEVIERLRRIEDKLDQGQAEDRQTAAQILDAIAQDRVEQVEAAQMVSELRAWAQAVQQTGLPLNPELRAALDALSEHTGGAYQYLQLAIPIIPGILSYNVELGSQHQANLKAIWGRIKARLGRGSSKAVISVPLPESAWSKFQESAEQRGKTPEDYLELLIEVEIEQNKRIRDWTAKPARTDWPEQQIEVDTEILERLNSLGGAAPEYRISQLIRDATKT
jgi:hypothetical protein